MLQELGATSQAVAEGSLQVREGRLGVLYELRRVAPRGAPAIGDAGLALLCRAVQYGHPVHLLAVAYNNITDVGAQQLLDAMMSNQALCKVDLEGNAVTEGLRSAIELRGSLNSGCCDVTTATPQVCRMRRARPPQWGHGGTQGCRPGSGWDPPSVCSTGWRGERGGASIVTV